MRPSSPITACAALGLAALAAGTVTAPATAAALPHRWVHHVDVDGDGARDRVVLVRGDDISVDHRTGSGHFRVRVHLASGNVVSKRMSVSYYYDGTGDHWSPWFGATQIDHVDGRDLVVGSTSGAHTQVYNVVAYRPGKLVKVISPGSGPEDGWTVNSSAGTGSWGWRCTKQGMQSRLVYPRGDGSRSTIDRARYLYDGSWQRTKHVHYTVDGGPPAYTNDYATFACNGLPAHW